MHLLLAISFIIAVGTSVSLGSSYSNPPYTVTTNTEANTVHQAPQQQRQQVHQQRQRYPQLQSTSTVGCDVPSDFWCDSYELARRCNAVEQCEQMRRDHRPVTVTLMYEALCPFCQRFISQNLGQLHSRFGNRINLELVPWGNAILLRNGQISCNHGPKECDANRLMSCVVDEMPMDQVVPFVICFERQLQGHQSSVEQAMHQCSSFIRNNYRRIKQCYVGERGQQLQRQAAQRTMGARSNPIVEVPYILVNNYSPNTDANTVNIVALTHLIQKWLNNRERL